MMYDTIANNMCPVFVFVAGAHHYIVHRVFRSHHCIISCLSGGEGFQWAAVFVIRRRAVVGCGKFTRSLSFCLSFFLIRFYHFYHSLLMLL